MMTRTRIALGALTLLLASACNATGSMGTAQSTYTGEEGEDEIEEEIGDPGLARELVMESVLTERRNDRLHVQFNLRNQRPTNLPLEWTIVWHDSRGFRIDTARHWTPVTLGGKGFETLSSTAPVPAATGFKLGVRRPSTVH